MFLTLYMLVYKSCTLRPQSFDELGTSRGVCLGLLDLIFFLVLFICPFGVSVVSGWYFSTLGSVIIGRPM